MQDAIEVTFLGSRDGKAGLIFCTSNKLAASRGVSQGSRREGQRVMRQAASGYGCTGTGNGGMVNDVASSCGLGWCRGRWEEEAALAGYNSQGNNGINIGAHRQWSRQKTQEQDCDHLLAWNGM